MSNELRTYLSPDQIKVRTIVLATEDWQQLSDGTYQQEVSISNVSSSTVGRIDIDMSEATVTSAAELLDNWAKVNRATTLENAICFTCYFEQPQIDLPVLMEVLG